MAIDTRKQMRKIIEHNLLHLKYKSKTFIKVRPTQILTSAFTDCLSGLPVQQT